MPAFINVLFGIAQPLIPAVVAYGVGAGWFTTADVTSVASIAAAIAAAAHSALTTQVVAPSK